MIVLKVKLKQEPSGALYAEVLDGLNSVSQNNRAKNILRVELDSFDLEDGVGFLQAGYSTSQNENDVGTETVNFALMSEIYGENAWEQEIPPEVVAIRGKWYLYLRVATFDGTGDASSVNNVTNEIEFTVNNALPAADNVFPNMGDIAALYAQSKESVSAAAASAEEAKEQAEKAAASAEGAQQAYEKAEALLDSKVDKVSSVNRLYATDNSGAQTAIPYSQDTQVEAIVQRDSRGRIKSEGPEEETDTVNKKYADEQGTKGIAYADSLRAISKGEIDGLEERKLDKAGGFVEGDLTVQGNFTVQGTNFVEDAETYTVKENVIVTNSEGQDIKTHLSGLATKKNQSKAYGIMYDPASDGVRIGQGEVKSDGEFEYDTDENGESEGQFIATREDEIGHAHLPKWNDDKKRFDDSGIPLGIRVGENSAPIGGTGGRTYGESSATLAGENNRSFRKGAVSTGLDTLAVEEGTFTGGSGSRADAPYGVSLGEKSFVLKKGGVAVGSSVSAGLFAFSEGKDEKYWTGGQIKLPGDGLSFTKDEVYTVDENWTTVPKTFEAYIKLPYLAPASNGVIPVRGCIASSVGKAADGYSNMWTTPSFDFEIHYNNCPRFYCITGPGTKDYTFSYVHLPTDEWVHVAIVHDGTHLLCYVNGEMAAPALTVDIPAFISKNPVRIGTDHRNTDVQVFDGSIKYLRFYSDVRTAAEIKSDYENAASLTPDTDNLIAAYDFTQSGSAYLEDLSDNHYNISCSAELITDEKTGITFVPLNFDFTVTETTNAAGEVISYEFKTTGALGDYSHSEGKDTLAEGEASHSQGTNTYAKARNSDAGGEGTIAVRENQTVRGQFNKPNPKALFILGNGTDENNRSNAFEVLEDGGVIALGILNLIYPVGHVLLTTNKTFDPNENYAGTVWERVSKNSYLYIADEASAGQYGGQQDFKISEGMLPSHTHDMSHTHSFVGQQSATNYSELSVDVPTCDGTAGDVSTRVRTMSSNDTTEESFTTGGHTHTFTAKGYNKYYEGASGSTGSNEPYKPYYYGVIAWRRTA